MVERTSDICLNLHEARAQTGPFNDRVYLMDPGNESGEDLSAWLLQLAQSGSRARIMAKVPQSRCAPFLARGFVQEARIPGFFRGEAGVFLAAFLKPERREDPHKTERKKLLDDLRQSFASGKKQGERSGEWQGSESQILGEDHAESISRLLSEIFPCYPFPVHDPDFIREEMRHGTRYAGFFSSGGELIAMASAECNAAWKHAECTDFATRPEWRGKGFAGRLLEFLSRNLRQDGYTCLYTIARSLEVGMNRVFARAGWGYAGTLVNSTCIGSGIESMNIWYSCSTPG